MIIPRDSELTQEQKNFLSRAIDIVEKDSRFIGLAVGGSIAKGSVDEYSDIDFLVLVEPKAYEKVLENPKDIAKEFGSLLAGFTGEHVGDDRIFICLFGPPLLHVDFKFIIPGEKTHDGYLPTILVDKNNIFSREVSEWVERLPKVNIQWIEDRFWVWVHYAAVKVARGEFFETLDFLAFLRRTVLVPLALNEASTMGFGVRKVEQKIPDFSRAMTDTIGKDSRESLIKALQACISLYLEQRQRFESGKIELRKEAEKYAVKFLNSLENPD